MMVVRNHIYKACQCRHRKHSKNVGGGGAGDSGYDHHDDGDGGYDNLLQHRGACNTTVEAISRRYGYKAEGCRGGLGVKKR